MSDTKTSGNSCNEFRKLFDRIADGDQSVGPAARKAHDEHVADCSSCQSWKAQTLQIIDMSSALPSFDVSEALTQRILNSVETERKKSISLERLPAAPLCVMAATAIVLLLPAEGLQGALSWSAGILGLLLLQILLRSASAQESLG